MKVVKNKMAPPFRQAKFEILCDEGVWHTGELIDLGVRHGLVEKSGVWYSLDGERIGHGHESTRQHLADNPKTAESLEKRVR